MRNGQSGAGMMNDLFYGQKEGWQPVERVLAAGQAAIPPSVTRGESLQTSKTDRLSKIDWLNCTFPEPSMSLNGLIKFLGRLFDMPLGANLDGGMFGFTERWKLRLYVNGVMQEVGCICRGGEAQKGRWMLQLTGKGCGLLTDWDSLRELLEGLGARLTRVDVAVDLLDGEYTVNDAVDWSKAGLFTCGGRSPTTSVAGDWIDEKLGRTLYVGKPQNGKMLRVYEKGKQLGDLDSKWVRFEVQFGNRDRVIPFDALTDSDKFFCGAYPALEQLLNAAAELIPTTQNESLITIAHLLHHLKRCYGKALHQVMDMCAINNTDIVEEMRVIGIPRRLDPAGVVAGLDWTELQIQLQRYEQ